MRLIVVTGMPGAGKEELLTAATSIGIPFVRMGDVVREFYANSDAESKGLSVGEFATAQRKEFGPDIWAKRVMEKAGDGDLCLIDGCRSRSEIDTFVALGGKVTTIAVHASPSVRYDRLVKRARADAPATKEEFDARDSRELGWGSGEVIALADYVVPNMGSLEKFRSDCAELLRSLR